jgi:hypothetical protein
MTYEEAHVRCDVGLFVVRTPTDHLVSRKMFSDVVGTL